MRSGVHGVGLESPRCTPGLRGLAASDRNAAISENDVIRNYFHVIPFQTAEYKYKR